jgi:hypothetical protein
MKPHTTKDFFYITTTRKNRFSKIHSLPKIDFKALKVSFVCKILFISFFNFFSFWVEGQNSDIE